MHSCEFPRVVPIAHEHRSPVRGSSCGQPEWNGVERTSGRSVIARLTYFIGYDFDDPDWFKRWCFAYHFPFFFAGAFFGGSSGSPCALSDSFCGSDNNRSSLLPVSVLASGCFLAAFAG